MKHKLLFLSLLLHSLVASADAVEIDGIYYSLNGNEASVTGNPDNYTGDIVIPSTVYYNDSEYEVVSIEDGAFRDCNYLTSIAIPNCVTNIGSNVFRGCSSLTSITIPRNVTNIGSFSFAKCSSLNSINVEEGNMKYDSREDCNAIIETESNKLIAGCKET